MIFFFFFEKGCHMNFWLHDLDRVSVWVTREVFPVKTPKPHRLCFQGIDAEPFQSNDNGRTTGSCSLVHHQKIHLHLLLLLRRLHISQTFPTRTRHRHLTLLLRRRGYGCRQRSCSRRRAGSKPPPQRSRDCSCRPWQNYSYGSSTSPVRRRYPT